LTPPILDSLLKHNPDLFNAWFNYSQAKVALKASSHEELWDLYDKAKINGIQCGIVLDEKELFGQSKSSSSSSSSSSSLSIEIEEKKWNETRPRPYCVALGPASVESITNISGHLKLL